MLTAADRFLLRRLFLAGGIMELEADDLPSARSLARAGLASVETNIAAASEAALTAAGRVRAEREVRYA